MTNDSPKVSVVIPVYNRSHLIHRTLDCLTKQRTSDFEVIIIDDCSDDSEQLVDVLKRYDGALKIHYHRHTTNQHGAAARNTGITMSTGEFIALLDSDDLWHPDKLKICTDYLTTHSESSVVYSQIEVDEGRGLTNKPKVGKPQGTSVGDYLLYNFGTIQTSSLFIRANVAKRVMFDPDLKRFQDYDFCLRLEEHGYEFDFIPEPLVTMTDDDIGNRISNSIELEPIEHWLNKIRNRVSRKAKATFIINRLVRCLLLSGNKLSALKHLLKLENIIYCRKRVWLTMLAAALTPSFLYTTLRKVKRSL